jgi:plastocyanin
MGRSFARTAITALLTAALGQPGAAASPRATLPAAVTIHIKDFAYRPTPVTIHAGDRIAFVNDDDEAHTITATDKSYDSGGLDTTDRYEHVFTTPGTYTYFCELHPYMKASIIVLPATNPGGGR